MAKIFWRVGDLFVHQDPASQVRKSYGVVLTTPAEECVLISDTGLRTGRYKINSGFIPETAVPLPPVERRNIPFEVKMALEAVGAAIGVANFCTRR